MFCIACATPPYTRSSWNGGMPKLCSSADRACNNGACASAAAVSRACTGGAQPYIKYGLTVPGPAAALSPPPCPSPSHACSGLPRPTAPPVDLQLGLLPVACNRYSRARHWKHTTFTALATCFALHGYKFRSPHTSLVERDCKADAAQVLRTPSRGRVPKATKIKKNKPANANIVLSRPLSGLDRSAKAKLRVAARKRSPPRAPSAIANISEASWSASPVNILNKLESFGWMDYPFCWSIKEFVLVTPHKCILEVRKKYSHYLELVVHTTSLLQDEVLSELLDFRGFLIQAKQNINSTKKLKDTIFCKYMLYILHTTHQTRHFTYSYTVIDGISVYPHNVFLYNVPECFVCPVDVNAVYCAKGICELINMWMPSTAKRESGECEYIFDKNTPIPPLISIERLRCLNTIHESNVYLVCLREDMGKEYVYKTAASVFYPYLYHEIRNLLVKVPHPNIIPAPLYLVYHCDNGEDEPDPAANATTNAMTGGVSSRRPIVGFLVPYIEGRTLDDAVSRLSIDEKLDLQTRLKWSRQVAEGVLHIHRHGWGVNKPSFHSDLKPNNIIVSRPTSSSLTGDVVLIDFEQLGNWSTYSSPEVNRYKHIERIREESERVAKHLYRTKWEFSPINILNFPGSLRHCLQPRAYPGWQEFWGSVSQAERDAAAVFSVGMNVAAILSGYGCLRRPRYHDINPECPLACLRTSKTGVQLPWSVVELITQTVQCDWHQRPSLETVFTVLRDAETRYKCLMSCEV